MGLALGDPFWRVQTLAFCHCARVLADIDCLGVASPQSGRQFPRAGRTQLRRMLHHRHSALTSSLFAATKSMLGLLQALFGYDALSNGLVMSPAGIFAVLAMPIVGRLLGLKTDARWLIAIGLLLMTAGNYWMSQLNLDISPGQVVWPRVVLVAGACGIFCSRKRSRVSLYAAGVARSRHRVVESPAQRGGQRRRVLVPDLRRAARSVSRLRLGESLDPFNPAVNSFLARAQAFFLQQTGDPVAAQQLAWRRSKTCTSSRRLRLPISTPFG